MLASSRATPRHRKRPREGYIPPYEPRQEKGAADSGQAPFSTAKKRPGQGMAGAFLWEGKPYKREKRKKGRDQRWMRPEPSPPASFSTSETVTML